MAYTKYSLTPANNNAAPPDGAPEGMLPSAVNDTMRDMMAQIRDCGDGIRGGTYTMTAPVITGGSITGSTINNSAIGATTANSGAFTTLSASSTVTFSGLNASKAVFTNGSNQLVSNAITGTGNVVMSASPTLTGTLTADAITASGAIIGSGNWTLGNADTDTITVGASFVTGSVLRSAKVATNTLALAAYDVDGAAYTNLITLTASNTPTLALTSTGVGTINNMSIGATTASTGAFTTLDASSTVTLSGLSASQAVFTNASDQLVSNAITGTGSVVMSTSPTFTTSVIGGATFAAFNTTTTNLSMGGAATTLALGGTTATSTYNIATGATINASTKTVNIGTAGISGSITNINIGSAVSGATGTTTINNSLSYTGTLTGGTGVVNLGSGQFYKDASGNVGIGTTSPAAKLDVGYVGGSVALRVQRDSSNRLDFYQGGGVSYIDSSPASGQIAFATVGTERMRIDSSGNLLVGTTTLDGNAGVSIKPNAFSGAAQILFNRASTTALSYPLDFRNASTNVGGISYTNTATSFNTSSDYRLKENIAPMTEALNRVAKLKPVTYQWKVDGSAGEGFIAHELQAVVPDCVTGEKDAIDAEGKPVYQGIDTSFLVATLTKAIQEQQVMINELKAKVAALEAA